MGITHTTDKIFGPFFMDIVKGAGNQYDVVPGTGPKPEYGPGGGF